MALDWIAREQEIPGIIARELNLSERDLETARYTQQNLKGYGFKGRLRIRMELTRIRNLLYVQEVVTLQKKYSRIFASENYVYTVFLLLRYSRLNIIRLQSTIFLGHVNYIR